MNINHLPNKNIWGQALVDNLINLALAEDTGSGDITTDAIVSQNVKGEAYVVAKEDMVLSGINVFKKVFQNVSGQWSVVSGQFKERYRDGEIVRSEKIIIEISGNMRSLLTAERTALNFLQRMSGIATLTKKFVDSVKGFKAKIIDTRKTTPCLRILEKYAVQCGGGIIKAVKRVRDNAPHLIKIEVETKSLKEVKDALNCKADVIMLDNMDIPAIKKAVKLIDKRALIEVSGGVTLKNVSEIAATGVDYISIGALTHSARAVDISMEIR